MKLLLDQNLSRRLKEALRDLYPESVHVSDIGLESADDFAGLGSNAWIQLRILTQRVPVCKQLPATPIQCLLDEGYRFLAKLICHAIPVRCSGHLGQPLHVKKVHRPLEYQYVLINHEPQDFLP